MNLYFRLLKTLIVSFLQAKTPIQAEQRITFRVWPSDLDFNLHMNNGRYLTLMDLGRLQFMVRTGLARHILRERWMPVVGAVQMRYRRSLSPFSRFTLTTRLVSWDAKWVYLEQRFLKGEMVMAVGMVRALIRGQGKSVPTVELLARMGVSGGPPSPPPLEYFPEGK